MTTYIYLVKCPSHEDEYFDFFEDAKACALSCLADKPIITQTEVERNDFGECTNHCNLGTVWSWEDVMSEPESKADDSCFHVLCKADLEDIDSEFDSIDNSVDCEIEEISEAASILDATRAPKDTDYIIAVRSASVGSYTFLSMNYKLTPDVNKAMTYSSKFAAEEEIKYAIDELQRLGDKYINSYNTDRVFVTTFGKAKNFPGRYDLKALQRHNPAKESCERKPIHEGMTIEQLVEEMEENEDTVECTKCGNLVEKASCHHNKEGFGWCCTTCEPADTLVEDELHDLGNTYDGGYPEIRTWMCYHNGNDLGTVEAATAEEAYLKMEQTWPFYNYNNEDVQVIPVDEIEEDSVSTLDILEEAADYRQHLAPCPECGAEASFDKETGICIECGFNLESI